MRQAGWWVVASVLGEGCYDPLPYDPPPPTCSSRSCPYGEHCISESSSSCSSFWGDDYYLAVVNVDASSLDWDVDFSPPDLYVTVDGGGSDCVSDPVETWFDRRVDWNCSLPISPRGFTLTVYDDDITGADIVLYADVSGDDIDGLVKRPATSVVFSTSDGRSVEMSLSEY